MLNSTLFEILRSFDKEEFKRFEDLLKSPYYNKNSNVLKLFNVIKKYFPAFKHDNVKRETVWTNLFPVKKFNYGIMKNLIYELQKLSEKFLHLQGYEKNKFEQELNLLQMLSNKNLHLIFEKNLKSFKAMIDKSAIDKNYYFYKYMLEVKEQEYLFYQNKTKDENFCRSVPMNESLMAFFFTSFFTENYNTFHESRYYNKDHDVKTLERVLQFFENNPIRQNEYVLMYYYALKTVIDINDDESYLKLKVLFNKKFESLSHEKKFNFSQALINFCSFKIMKGNTEYIKEQFAIYELMVENGVYNMGFDKYMSPFMYANIVSIAGNLKQFEWAERFIAEFRDKLHPSHEDQYFALANVSLNLKKKKFDDALRFLSGFKSRTEVEKITIKRFQLMIYYESGFLDQLYSLIDTSKHFITNDKKVSDSAKNIFNNFIYFVTRLAEASTGINTDKIFVDALRNEIHQREVTNKIWLLEKVNELSQRKG